VAEASFAVEPSHQVGLAEMLSALSHALDMTEGQAPGHTLRTCLIGLRLAEEAGLAEADREALYYALLLKDAGCSSNAARMAVLFGSSDQETKYRMKLVDWNRPFRLAVQTFRNVGRGLPFVSKLSHFLAIAQTEEMTRDLIAIRCDRGAAIVRQIGFPQATADAVRCLDEHWDGNGYPDGLDGEAIPLLARITLLAQTVETFVTADSMERALEVVRERRGTWFDPSLADRVLRWRDDRQWWRDLRTADLADQVVEREPAGGSQVVGDEGLDRIARAFAEIIDAKSPFTFRHSSNVADLACSVGRIMGFGAEARRRVYRAGLLHDIGKLGISNRILDKTGPLTPEERAEVERHPVYSLEILERVSAFQDFAEPAVLHHEKLDGSGYPWKRTAPHLEPAARILTVVDIFEALTADRPYRDGLTPAAALELLHEGRGDKYCPIALDALEAHAASL
jgi:HD-GYP domain-containing protein (c-di-GMP phosphodiesterase class II)